ncbi:MAG TPA: hypothetical protein VKU36_03590 [Candidatus Babeliales bacterium]|nr:hypothetical protein [Candidatus Babeliales bacterium]
MNIKFILFLSIILNTHLQSMEKPTEHEQYLRTFTEFIGNSLLSGNIGSFEQSLSELYPDEPFPFTDLALEEQYHIITLLTRYSTTRSLTIAGKIINSLAQTNKDLLELINEPHFCLKLIKHLADQFECSDEATCYALQTKEAKHRLSIQKQFENLFLEKTVFTQELFNNLYIQYKGYVDLNFTYRSFSEKQDDDRKNSLLIIATFPIDLVNNSSINATMINCLLDTRKININYSNAYGFTPLMGSCLPANTNALNLLCHEPSIHINLRTRQGTALTFLCESYLIVDNFIEKLKILLSAGADPAIVSGQGLTPLQIIEIEEDQEAIRLLKETLYKNNIKK